MKFGTRLALGFGLMLAFLVGITVVGILVPRESRAVLVESIEATSQKSALVAQMRKSLIQKQVAARRMRLTFDFEEARSHMQQITATQAQFEALASQLAAMDLSDHEKALLAEATRHKQQASGVVSQATELVDAFNPGQAAHLLATQASPLDEACLDAIDRLVEWQNAQNLRNVSDFTQASSRAEHAMVAIAAAALILAAVAAWLLARSITGPISLALDVARKVASGKLDIEIDGRGNHEAGQLLVALKDMVVGLRKASAAMELLARQDALTGIANRRRFDEVLEREWRRLARVAQQAQADAATGMASLLLIDVDHFKSYNDAFGHQQGDECLRRVASVVSAQAQRSSDLIARYGGEEFAVVLPDVALDGAIVVAERIRTAVAALEIPSAAAPHAMVTVSIGAACLVPLQGSTPAALITAADVALYQAKKLGRNRVEWNNGADPVDNGNSKALLHNIPGLTEMH